MPSAGAFKHITAYTATVTLITAAVIHMFNLLHRWKAKYANHTAFIYITAADKSTTAFIPSLSCKTCILLSIKTGCGEAIEMFIINVVIWVFCLKKSERSF
jgi:hypothetical protein